MRRYLITGLLIWVPLGITIWVLHAIVTTMDQSLLLLPQRWRPKEVFGFDVPGLGVVLTIVILFVTGLVSRNVLGRRIVEGWESLLGRIPVVKSIYNSVKQVSDTLFSSSGQAFRKALLVQWPREGVWTVAFLTGTPGADVTRHIGRPTSL